MSLSSRQLRLRASSVALFLSIAVILVYGLTCDLVCAGNDKDNDATAPDFDTDVAGLLISRCAECHKGDEPAGGLTLLERDMAMTGGDSGPAIIPGDPAASLLWQRVRDDEMPPKHGLSDAEKRLLKKWIASGAKWGTNPVDPLSRTTSTRAGRDWWSLQPPQAPELPNAPAAWCQNPIDAFVWQRLNRAGLQPSPQASPRALVRRLFFDLTGLPPTPEDVQAFAADPSDKAFLKLADRLLNSERYGERWARHWLDVVRFGESDGFERNFPRLNAWPYRDWIIQSLNNDMPYDHFVRMQLSGDTLVGGVDGAAATGYWVAGVHNTVVGGSRRMRLLARQDEIEEVLATLGQTFLGLTVNCARCHDHKFDPVTQRDYYQLASAVSGLDHGETTVTSADDAQRLATLEARLDLLRQQLAGLEGSVRERIIANRRRDTAGTAEVPLPDALWQFDSDLRDSRGKLHGTAVGDARIENGALVVRNGGYVQTVPLEHDVHEKTLSAWVQLDNLTQRGGAAISLETLDGVVFDAIVFGERDPQQWMAGSNGFVRTDSFRGQAESQAVSEPVHILLVYRKDGTITGYRNGRQYGQAILKSAVQPFAAGQSEFVFGLRHKPAGGNRHLSGRILEAAFYNRALTPREIAAVAGRLADYVSDDELVRSMDEEQRQKRTQLQQQIASLTQLRQQAAAAAERKIYTLKPKAPEVVRVLLRGDPDKPGDTVVPAGVASVAPASADFGLPENADEALRRQKLADWITDPRNPLFARVIVNRVWHYHFGTGLVHTPNDFGFNGGRPSHPQLLDWLAVWFQQNGYSLKKLHRLIVSSATWQQAGYRRVQQGEMHPAQIDASNRLLWRKTPRRLEAETLRDAMLCVAGVLDLKSGGPSFQDVTITANKGTTYYEPKESVEEATLRRTIYRFNPRGGRSALLDTFDCPDPSATAPRRAVTTTPLQSLSLLNNVFVIEMSRRFAERLRREAPHDTARQIQRAWLLAVAREPTPAEQTLSEQLVEKHGLEALTRGLFNISEFVVIE